MDSAFVIALKNNHKNVLSALLSWPSLFPSPEIFNEAYTYAEENNMKDMKAIIQSIKEANEDLIEYD